MKTEHKVKTYIRWWWYLLVGIAGFAILSMIALSHHKTIRIGTVYVPLIDAAKDIQFLVAKAHIFLEETLSGDRIKITEPAWDCIEQADWYARAMLEGGTNHEGTFIPLNNEAITQNVLDVRIMLLEFKEVALQRLAAREASGSGVDVDLHYHVVFQDLIEMTEKAEHTLQTIMAHDLSRYRLMHTLLVVAIGIIFYRFECNRNKDATRIYNSNEKLRKLSHAVEYSSATIVITDTEGNLEYANPKFTEHTGYSIEEVISKNLRILKSGITPSEVYDELWEVITSGNEWKGEFCNKKKSGEMYWEFASISPVKDDKGVITNFIAVKDEITEHKKMEKALSHSEKMKSIGTITAGISHEFNNLLAIISGNVQLLEEVYKDDKVLTDALCTIMKAIDDGAEISGNMLKFTKTRPDTKEFVSADIADLIRHSIDFTKPRWKNEAQANGLCYKMDTENMKKVPAIMCKPTEIREVFINIINNSLDAMPEGGSLSFSTRSADDTIYVSVTDSGEGMSEDVEKNVFDPFFSTKGVDGTGLGMSLAYGIAARHGGKIDVSNEIGKGTTFTLQFPVTNKRRSQKEAPDTEQKTNVKGLRILVVDDEKDICGILDKFLSMEGHKVKAVDNGSIPDFL